MLVSNYIVITRPKAESEELSRQIKSVGLQVLYCPSITISNNLSAKDLEKYLSNISHFDWIIFTSSNGVKFFIQGIQRIGKGLPDLRNIQIAAIGEKTADTAKRYGLYVNFIPSKSTSSDLANELNITKGNNILLPRSGIGNPNLKTIFESKGAIVTEMPVYKTRYLKTDMIKFKKLFETNKILGITFTSPSTVEGFLKNIKEFFEYKRLFSIPAISIGPTTTETLKNYQFENIYTADPHTIEGMIT